ncbi:MAG: polysaccharide biosynthesis tyrosine autokinase, partial [Polyangiaceae bacterium]
KRWLWVVALATVVTVAVAFYTAGQKRIYRSSGTIQIDPTAPKPLGPDVQAVVDLGTSSFWANNEYYQTQFKIIQSRGVSEEAVRRLSLQRDARFLANASPGQMLTPEQAQAQISVEDAGAIVRGRLRVEPVKDSRLVELGYDDADPERARQILSTVITVYVDRNVDVALDSTINAAEWLRGQVLNLKTELEGTEDALHEYKKGNRILSVSLDDQSNMLRQEMQQLSAALTAVRVRRAQVAAQAAELQTLDTSDAAGMASSELLKDGALMRLREVLAKALAERDSLLGEGKGERHPLVVSAVARLESARVALGRDVENIRQAAQRDLHMVEQEVQSLSDLYQAAEARAIELSRLEIDYRRLERSKTNTEKLYSLVIERSKESDLTRMMRFNNIQIIDAPVVPKSPIMPRVPTNMAFGLLGGLALGLFGAFVREALDRSVKSHIDVEENIGLTFLGYLPKVSQASRPGYGSSVKRRRRSGGESSQAIELAVHEDSTSAIAEAARGIRTNLSFMSPDKPFRSLLVTSAAPSEGKTTVACCLAIAMAQAGQKVLLIDCDLRRPRLHRIFGHANDRGVTTLLLDKSEISKAVYETEVPKLSVLLSGPSSPNPAESLQSKAFQSLLEELSQTYDRIVIDSAPVAPVTDAAILSTRVDATVLVIRALASARETVRHGRRTLLDVRANLVGAILNATDLNRQGYPYYYRYYGNGDAPPGSSPS